MIGEVRFVAVMAMAAACMMVIAACGETGEESTVRISNATAGSGGAQMEAQAPAGASQSEDTKATAETDGDGGTVQASAETDGDGGTVQASAETDGDGGTVQASAVQSAGETARLITPEDAKQIALQDAQVSEADVSYISVEQDWDNGRDVYEVEFYAQGTEYDYEISAASGEIVSKEQEVEDDFGGGQSGRGGNTAQGNVSRGSAVSGQSIISREEAIEIALGKVEGAAEQNIWISLDEDDGKQIYEGDIHYNGIEYEFEISAVDGTILEWSQEKED